MHFVMFYHSLVSDWNHGNAHFLRGVVNELLARGHQVDVYEPREGWSLTNLIEDRGRGPLEEFNRRYPQLQSHAYDPASIDLDAAIGDADIVVVHEWNDHDLVSRIGKHRHANAGYRLLFHDTHHRSVTDEKSIAAYDLRHYDGVLAFGQVIRDLYLERGWADKAWTWHEAADTRQFRPLPRPDSPGDLVWVGNWGDNERTEELHEYLLEPVKNLRLRATVHGVRYPEEGLQALREAKIEFGGWLPNFRVPEIFAAHQVTVHVPRRPYREQLHGVPTIRVFEALACGIPLVSASWEDSEHLFQPGKDFLVAKNGQEMQRHLQAVLHEPDLARSLAEHGLETIRRRHTCGHRVEELLAICQEWYPAEKQTNVEAPHSAARLSTTGRTP